MGLRTAISERQFVFIAIKMDGQRLELASKMNRVT